MLKTPEKPELIAKFRVDSVTSGECSHCREVIVVKNAAVNTLERLDDLLQETFAEHVAKKHM